MVSAHAVRIITLVFLLFFCSCSFSQNDPILMAKALNKEGKELLEQTKRVNKNRREARKKFTESLSLLSQVQEPVLRLDNLEQLKKLAVLSNSPKVAQVYQDQIEELKVIIASQKANKSLKSQAVLLEEKLENLRIQKQNLSQKVKTLTTSQLTSELLISLQKNQVDSLTFQASLDSLRIEQKSLMLLEQAAQLDLQESQIALQENKIQLQSSQRNFFLALAALVALFAFGAIARYLESKKLYGVLKIKNAAIEVERKRSEKLLLNILPAVVAKELKADGSAKARRYENATVLFSDFKNFSTIAKTLSPENLVKELDFYFKTFDSIIGKYNIEKIKTIGDAYMCVGGLPEANTGHPTEVVRAALEIQSALEALKKEREVTGQPFFEARIGIHTGPLVAGVVGHTKFAFDVWGDTVNVASRLESNGEVGKVNISATTYELIRENFTCQSRGNISIKNRGEVEMYFVTPQ